MVWKIKRIKDSINEKYWKTKGVIDNFYFSFSVSSCYDNPRYGRSCQTYRYQRYCLTQRSFMLQNCPKTCGFCLTSRSSNCGNVASNRDCTYWWRSGYCRPGNVYYRHMQNNCKLTCGFCNIKQTKKPKKPMTKVTTTATTTTAVKIDLGKRLFLYFFYQLIGCLKANFRPLTRMQLQWHNVYQSFCYV